VSPTINAAARESLRQLFTEAAPPVRRGAGVKFENVYFR
jgi:hypothetical protein